MGVEGVLLFVEAFHFPKIHFVLRSTFTLKTGDLGLSVHGRSPKKQHLYKGKVRTWCKIPTCNFTTFNATLAFGEKIKIKNIQVSLPN